MPRRASSARPMPAGAARSPESWNRPSPRWRIWAPPRRASSPPSAPASRRNPTRSGPNSRAISWRATRPTPPSSSRRRRPGISCSISEAWLPGELPGNQASEIEQEMPGLRRRLEEGGVGRVARQEMAREFGPDLVGFLRDAGADGGDDARRGGAQILHRGDGRFQDSGERAAPAGMGRADDARLGIGEQHRRAIRCQYAERDARHARHHGVGAAHRLAWPGRLDDDRFRAMHLLAGGEAGGRQVEHLHRAGAILDDMRRRVGAGEAAIERGENAAADAARAREEGVAEERMLERVELDHLSRAKPAGGGAAGLVSASALNRVPICAGSIKRRTPAASDSTVAASFPAPSVARRAATPSDCSHAPCAAGPQARAPAAVAAAAKDWKSTCAVRSALPGSRSGSCRRCAATAWKLSPGARGKYP